MAADFAGSYRPVVTPELLAFVERAFVEPAPAEQRDEVRSAALAELSDAELVLEADGTLISRSQGVDFVRVQLSPARLGAQESSFEKAPGVIVTLRRIDADTLVADQPGKPAITFRRR
ncbi:MAG TPA: hypothetical protein VNN72_15680 [Polyangiaceae bacterium]|nr:hypothetical protein [Polyangiaceae bacterium]